MRTRAYIVTEAQSRYSLLGAFGLQFGAALQRAGLDVNPDPGGPVSWGKPGAAAYVFFNHLASVEEAYGWAGQPTDRSEPRSVARSIIQWCVDHPLTLHPEWLDRMSRDPGFRLLTVTADDSHLLSLRYPNLRHATVWHGVDESALCVPPTAALGGRCDGDRERDIDVLIAASIASAAELERWRGEIPGALHRACDEVIALRLAHPAMSFGQSLDLALPTGLRASEHWLLMQKLFAYTTAAVGRERRIAVARAMQGLDSVLVGTEAWKEVAGGTIRYAGHAAYGELPAWMKRAKVCVAVSPPQFATGFSERVLLAMAAGCATVAEERAAIGREFGKSGAVVEYAPERPEMARIAVGKLLDDVGRRAAMGSAGRDLVARGHLWVHRVEPVLAAAGLLDAVVQQRAAA